MDKERHTVDKMYLETATLAWNGNSVDGLANIQVSEDLSHLPLSRKRCTSTGTWRLQRWHGMATQ
jgi:hypothetical protein